MELTGDGRQTREKKCPAGGAAGRVVRTDSQMEDATYQAPGPVSSGKSATGATEPSIAQRGLERSEILRPGEFEAIPKGILARPDLTPTAKLVCAALLSFLRTGERCAWPSHSTIAAMIGAGCTTVKVAMRALEKAGVLAVERWNGGSCMYRFMKVCQSGTDSESPRPNPPTLGQIRLGKVVPDEPRPNPPITEAESAYYPTEDPIREEPPTPFLRKGGACAFQDCAGEADSPAAQASEETTVAAADAAWRAVMGTGMPS